MILSDFEWSSIRAIGNSNLVKSSYVWIIIVPFVLKVVEFLSTRYDYQYEVENILPFSWLLFFLSALFFCLGQFIYQIRCPLIIKEFGNYADFLSEGKNSQHVVKYFQLCGKGFFSGLTVGDMHKFVEDHDSDESNDKVLVSLNFNNEVESVFIDKCYEPHLFWFCYDLCNQQYRVSFFLSLVCFLIGVSLLLYVSCENIYFVLSRV